MILAKSSSLQQKKGAKTDAKGTVGSLGVIAGIIDYYRLGCQENSANKAFRGYEVDILQVKN